MCIEPRVTTVLQPKSRSTAQVGLISPDYFGTQPDKKKRVTSGRSRQRDQLKPISWSDFRVTSWKCENISCFCVWGMIIYSASPNVKMVDGASQWYADQSWSFMALPFLCAQVFGTISSITGQAAVFMHVRACSEISGVWPEAFFMSPLQGASEWRCQPYLITYRIPRITSTMKA